jgi:hypothetical protein
MDRRQRLIYGGIAGVVALSVVIIIIIMTRPHQSKPLSSCVPTKDKPNLNSMHVENILSSDKTVLANLVGYLHLVQDGTYLPVELNEVLLDQRSGKNIVTLLSNCVEFQIVYKDIIDHREKLGHAYGSIKMAVKDDTKVNEDFNQICVFERSFEFDQPYQTRYSCQEERKHHCSVYVKGRHQDRVADLVLRSFELELDVEPSVGKGQMFTKEPFDSSCTLWSF